MLILSFFLLMALTRSYCSSNCLTCDVRCTSCPKNYFLLSYTCYSCDKYSDSSCDSQSGNDQDAASTIKFVAIVTTSFILACCCLRCIYRRCQEHCIDRQQPEPTALNQPQVIRIDPSHQYLAHHPPYPVSIALPQISMHSFQVQTKWRKDNQNFTEFDQNCVICLENAVFLQTHCHHNFHPVCIWQWALKKHGACPLCKSFSIFPMKIFCRKCLTSYYQVDAASLEKLCLLKRWNNCKDCQQ